MGHKAQTRRMANAGKKTGLSSRRSLKPRGAFAESMRATRSLNPFDLKPEVRDALNERIKGTEQFWNNLSHEWFGTNPKSFPYNMGKWDPPTLSPPIKPTGINPSDIPGGWPEYAEAVEQQDQRDKHAWPSRNDQALLPKEEPKEKMGDGGLVWPKYARAQDRVIKGHRGRDIKRYAKSLVTKQSHR